jgi:predicted DNA-binding protein (UPF0251 family)
MSRPKKERNVCLNPDMVCGFMPIWKNTENKEIETVDIFCDEMEAMKLINLDDMNMKEGGEKMWVSAPTFNRIVNSAYKKVTDAIINGKWLVVKKCED